jgi:hypothetical protein
VAGTAADSAASGQDRGLQGTAEPDGITAEALRDTFPQWRTFPAAGSWRAMRGMTVAWDGPGSLLRRVITAPYPTRLAERLCLQEQLDGLDTTALAVAYRDMGLPGAVR